MTGGGLPPTEVTPPAWDDVLDELADRLERYRSALDGRGPFPAPYGLPPDLGPLPPRLAARARSIVAGQHDVEHELRARLGALGALVHGHRAGPAFLDAKA